MRRRMFLGVLAGGLVTAPVTAQAEQAKVVRIGLLDLAASESARNAWWKMFHDRLRELGYVEGQNVIFESRWGDGQPDRMPALAAELIKAKVELIVTAGSEAALAAKQATSSIPIVMATGADPVELGLVAGLARPGGNVTGVTSIQSELASKRLELLKQLMPRVARVGIMWDVDNRASTLIVRDAEHGAKSLGVVLHRAGIRDTREAEAAFLTLKRVRVEAVILVASPEFIGERRRFADLAITHRLPMVVGSREYAEAGGLLSYGTDYPDLFRRAATYVDKILKGAKPGGLPIEQPTKLELVINLKTAKALGLTIPPSLLARADQVIE